MKKEKVLDIICLQCKHFDTVRIGGCKAFPGEIPDVVLSGESNHSSPIRGQEGDYVYTPIEEPVKIWKQIDRSLHQFKKAKRQPEFK